MTLDQAVTLVAQRSGKHPTANRTDILTALTAAMEEIGTYIDIRKAQSTESKTLAANASSVVFPSKFQRIISVSYRYTSGGDTIRNDLSKKEPAEFDRLNEGVQNQTTDDLDFFMVSGNDINVGPGIAYTGGTLVIRGQRQLTTNDIADLPNTMLAVHGGVSNLLPSMNPDNTVNAAGAAARRLFEAGLYPSKAAAVPVKQEYDTMEIGEEMLKDDAYRSTL